MGRGKKCNECGSPMYAQNEKCEPKGTTAIYVCRNGTCSSVPPPKSQASLLSERKIVLPRRLAYFRLNENLTANSSCLGFSFGSLLGRRFEQGIAAGL